MQLQKQSLAVHHRQSAAGGRCCTALLYGPVGQPLRTETPPCRHPLARLAPPPDTGRTRTVPPDHLQAEGTGQGQLTSLLT